MNRKTLTAAGDAAGLQAGRPVAQERDQEGSKINRKTLVAAIIGLALLASVPLMTSNSYYVHMVGTIMIYAILLYGLDIVVGYTGQVSLGHAGLFGVGSYTAGVLFMKLGAPLWLIIPASIAVTASFGALLALPALRVTGPYLAMVTLAFGTIVQILINEMTFLTEGPLGIKIPKPSIAGFQLNENGFYWLVFALMVVSLVVVDRILRSQLGRAFEALRGSPVASDCMGVSVYRYKVYAFVISAGFAGLAGCLYAYSEQYISPNTYNFELTVLFLLAVIMGGRKTRSGALLGAAIIVILPKLLDDLELFRIVATALAALIFVGAVVGVIRKITTPRQMAIPVVGTIALAGFAFWLQSITDWRLSIFGLMILFVVYYLQNGIVGFVRALFHMRKPVPSGGISAIAAGSGKDAIAVAASAGAAETGDLLIAKGVLMQFGGLKAINQVDLQIRRGTIHGLIGPNGSGKSTMMNVLTGIYVPTAGSIEFAGRSVVGRTSSDIALSGIARTFQNVQLFGEMTALQNVQVGLHHTFGSTIVDVALHTPRYKREETSAIKRGLGLLRFVGLDDLASEEARNLPYGKQRLLEIARALALDPQLLLLDEPAAGLTAPDIRELVTIIRKIRDHGITVILIEHHMDVVMSMCDTVTVLDFGQKIAEGLPAAVQADEKVIAAYLGGTAA
jgi:ABC-type branched-subunit amino acid transport system ATPase component/ABC-type branched-subunit amino acid transport system permease subunit